MRIRDYAIPSVHRPLHPVMLPTTPTPLPVIPRPGQQLKPTDSATPQTLSFYELEDRSKPSISSF